MVDIEALRTEVEALLTRLARQGAETGGPAAEPMGDADKTPVADDDHLGLLQELSNVLADMTDSADAVVSAHPFAAVGAAFMLGVAVGRLSRG